MIHLFFRKNPIAITLLTSFTSFLFNLINLISIGLSLLLVNLISYPKSIPLGTTCQSTTPTIKVLTLLLICLIAVSSIFAQGQMESERPVKQEVKTGLALITSASGKAATSKGDGQGTANISLVAVTVDENGKIESCVIDAI